MPAPLNSGLAFVRVDLPSRPVLPVRSDYVVDTALATSLGRDGVKVSTVEHVLAAVVGLGIDNLRIEIDGPEVPIADGSAEPFVRAMVEAGARRQGEGRRFLVMKRAVTVTDGAASASTTFAVTVTAPPPASAQLSVTKTGAGTVTPDLASTTLVAASWSCVPKA